MYVIDTNVWSQLFRFYYTETFPTLWEAFDNLVLENRVTSTREVRRELQAYKNTLIADGMNRYKKLFEIPSAQEEDFVTTIFSNQHFQHNISRQTLLKGGINADALVIARAKILNWSVVTEEVEKPNAAKIPNICKEFGIQFMNLATLMKNEGWVF